MKSIPLQSSPVPGILLVALAALFTHCKDHTTQTIFDKTSLQRGEEQKILLREKLKASQYGWKILYHPAPYSAGTGHFRFLFRFLNDTEVEVAGDYLSEDLDFRKSEYSILLGSTVKLSFSTASALHRLSDSGNSPVPGAWFKGLLGSFEFLYYGENEKGDLIFRTNRSNKTLLFQKATENSLNEIKASYTHFEKLTFMAERTYIVLAESKGADRNLREIEFSPWRRTFLITKPDIKDTSPATIFKKGYTIAFGLNPDGIFVDGIILSSGEAFTNVQFKNASNSEEELRLETTLSDGTVLTISNSNESVFPVTYIKDFLTTSSRLNFFCFRNNGSASTEFNSILEDMQPHGFTGDFSLCHRVQLHEEKADYLTMPKAAGVENLPLFQGLIYVFDNKSNRLVIKKNGSIDAGGAVKPEMEGAFNKFMTVLTDPDGFYFKGTGPGYFNFGSNKIEIEELVRFISVKYPDITFTCIYETGK